MGLSLHRPLVLGAAAAVGIGLLVWSSATRADESPTVARAVKWPSAPPASPIAVGQPSDADVAPLLAEMRAQWQSAGIDLALIDPVEVLTMNEAPGRPVAIPPRSYWPRMAQTIRLIYIPVRRAYGKAITILSGYRAPSYNKAVGGAPDSRHMWFESLDFIPEDGSAENRRTIALHLARMYETQGEALDLALGIYGRTSPSFHVDTGGKGHRKWEDTGWWLEQLKAVA